jgi:triosephosphate isomerase (TIM)
MSLRRPLIAGNWKMYKNCAEAVETAAILKALVKDVTAVDIMIAPSFTSLSLVSEVLSESNIHLGAQNLSWHEEGAYTGEVSPGMIVSAGCDHVIIGHSERRQYYHETDETVNKRIVAAIKHDLVPVFCVGETESEREANITFSVLDKQVTSGLQDIALEDLAKLVIAYEPVWAIGTGKTATTEQAQEVHQFLRSQLEKAYGSDFAASVRILYGGSVKPANVAELMSMPDVDGGLVGGASLDAETFSKIVLF